MNIICFSINRCIFAKTRVLSFAEESVSGLILISCDTETDSFTVQNLSGEQVTGYRGDYLGQEGGKIIKVTNNFIVSEAVETIINNNGEEKEQRSRTKIPVTSSIEGRGKGIN